MVEINDVEAMRQRLRAVLREVNELIAAIGTSGLRDGTHALASALRQRLDDLTASFDAVLAPMPGSTRPPMPRPTEVAAVDDTILRGLLEDLGDAGRVSFLVQLFLTELHGRRTALMAAIEQVDVAAAKSVACTLKSSALLLGAAPLGKACEALVANESPAQLRRLVDDVLQSATGAARWFQIWLSNQPVAS